MKRLWFLALAFLFVSTLAYAMASSGQGGQASKCFNATWTCSLGAFSSCVNSKKVFDPNKVGYNGAVGGWTIDTNSPAFKACQETENSSCMKKSGC